MRITIQSPGERTIRLVLPTRLLFNSFTARIGARTINKYVSFDNMKVSSSDFRHFIKEVNRMKHKYPGLELVDIESSNGEIVKIRI